MHRHSRKRKADDVLVDTRQPRWTESSHGEISYSHHQAANAVVNNSDADARDASYDEDSDKSDNDSEELVSGGKAPYHHARRIPDWRSEICRLLGKPHDISDDLLLDGLLETSVQLQELKRLKERMSSSVQKLNYRYQLINRISCQQERRPKLSFESPVVVGNRSQATHLRCIEEIHNLELYLERNKEVSFLVYRDFECCRSESTFEDVVGNQNTSDEVKVASFIVREYVSVVSLQLRAALNTLSKSALEGFPHPDFHNSKDPIQHPYIWWFHHRERIEIAMLHMDTKALKQIELFQKYLMESLGQEWKTVDKLLSSGKITPQHLPYLFIPGEIIINDSGDDTSAGPQAFVLSSWTNLGSQERRRFRASLEVLHWVFDGTFERAKSILKIDKIPEKNGTIVIQDLLIYPRRFADPEIVEILQDRGKMWWRCRHRNYVCLKTPPDDGLREMTHSRCMVDMTMYKIMHRTEYEQTPAAQKLYELEKSLMLEDEPPSNDDFLMCLPMSTYGFNMQKKEWVELQVDDIEDVTFNKNAFDVLVLNEDTKQLVEAVVTNRIEAEERTDVVPGKGNGLFLLLHGGPGTGKTLTAESVAEIAQKPLYRVTCGDIGTKADEVEKYLETVLMLGNEWRCVVLLDEADVFLEKRSLNHLERNALVSVFLRVLEYYDGILILTSNRVGTFDEAFKSRIQLSLRYHNLGPDQRRQIWENFIKRLEHLESCKTHDYGSESGLELEFQASVDTSGIRKHLDTLAKSELNGREIRNAISTARQLAMFLKEPMGYKHLERVIKEANKFEEYINDLHQGVTRDEYMEDRGIR